MSGPAARGRRSIAALMLPSLCLLALTGCSGGISQQLSTPVRDAGSAVNASLLALRQESAGRTTEAALKVTLQDELDQVNSAYADAAKLSASSQDDLRLQQQVLALLQATTTTALTVQRASDASDAESLKRSTSELQDRAKTLEQLEQSLKAGS